jgi:hypothetical protein
MTKPKFLLSTFRKNGLFSLSSFYSLDEMIDFIKSIAMENDNIEETLESSPIVRIEIDLKTGDTK